ncbi:MAG: 4Fe-4S binding protein, partial [Anaerolineales bacterium]|nr:4Fe-4S binding protein [Anaerolineales bacterium]
PPYIELSRCTSCGDCVLSCLYNAISMKSGSLSRGILNKL